MEHIAAFLLIVGCSPDLAQCRELPAPLPVYETIEDCQAGIGAASAAHEGAAPRVFSRCFEVDPLLTETDAEIVWDVTAEGGLTATVEPYEPPDVLVASNRGDDAETVVKR
ncbi:MAG: hypothetical protein DCC69_03475 [Hyphomicrobiales bacterium]|nr:MAG: hypothetical protein DCC69_03475 [Hyphomicrobiales bacterium]